MKILMVSPSYGISNGGAENQLRILNRYLKKKNYVKIINIFNLKFYPLSYFKKIFYEYIKIKYNIIHIHTFNSPAWFVALINYFFNFKTIVKITLSGKNSRIENIYKNYFLNFFFKIIFNHKKIYFHAITKIIQNKLIKIGINKKQIFYCPNGVKITQKPKKNNKIKKIIYFGRLIPRKKIFEFTNFYINNFHLLKKFDFHIYGDGPELEKIIKLDNINKIKIFKSQSHEQMLKTLRKYDICINPSLNEGMSNSILESMSAGLMVIARKNKENNEIIENNQNGYLFKNDTDLLNIFKNLAQNKKILNNANKFICQKHDIQKIAKKFQNFYYKIL
jgi:glycosyltransferase involved in cell wall biosynthesis